MRIAMVVVVALAACASGGKPDNGDVDASPGVDGMVTQPDAQVCGGAGQLPCDGVYVATNGNDSAAGTRGAPLKTIAMGIAKAGATGKPSVFVRAGSYSEQITMSPGVTLYGGFDETWTRSPGVTTAIVGASPVVKFTSITVATAIDTITIKANDASVLGESSFAVVATSSQMVELRDVEIEAGIGAAGGDGTNGTNGTNGNPGQAGKPGVERSNSFDCDWNAIPTGGDPGTNFSCGRDGGIGGEPGVGGAGGQPGWGAPSLTPGGDGALGESLNGSPGSDGLTGANGGSGAAGAVGVFSDGAYVPASGGNGFSGNPGNGGGGGGGGGGGTTQCDSTGSSGGGGGAGGCGATGGTGGRGGGGSFGVIAVDSSVVIKSSVVSSSRGGAGGRGGNGGIGGTGGAGGAGGPYGGSAEQDDGGFGAAGGRGGNGGNGGHGGGGGGGPSAAVVCVGSASITVPQTMLVAGIGGAGGTSLTNPGTTGTVTNAIGCQFF